MEVGVRASTERNYQDGTRCEFMDGEVIFKEGEPGERAFMIEQGGVEIYLETNEQDVPMARRGPGEVFGEMALIDGGSRSASARAIGTCELISITRGQLAERIHLLDPVLRMCMLVMLDRFRATLKSVEAAEASADSRACHSCVDTTDGTHDDYTEAVDRIKLERELIAAVHANQFKLHYQPVIDLQSQRIAGFEALIRWQHPERGAVPPGAFISVAESSGVIVEMSHWALRQACEFLSRLMSRQSRCDSGYGLFVAVNVSGADVTQGAFADTILAIAGEAGLAASNVKLEITESVVLAQPELAARSLSTLKDAGFSVAIDDFGTGYSSLSYLYRYPFDTLKIDRSFVRGVLESAKMNRLVQSIVALARGLELDVVAEGVETPGQHQMLVDLGCGYAQGFLYARPMPECDVESGCESWRESFATQFQAIS